MNTSFINSENFCTVIAWCSVLTLGLSVGMTIYQFVQQQKQHEALKEAQEAMKQLPMSDNQQPKPTAA